MKPRVLLFVGIWLGVSAAALSAPGCYGRNCEGGTEIYGPDSGQGRMIDDDTWESNPINGTWLWFPRQRSYIFDVPALGGRIPQVPLAYLSATPEPSKNGANFTTGAGNLALFSGPWPNRIDVKNDSCSDYFLRLVIQLDPLPPNSPPNSSAEAGANDAGENDAGADPDAGDGGP